MVMKVSHIFIALLVFLVGCHAQGVKNIKPDEFEKAMTAANVQLVDVRTPEEFADKHLNGATNINVNDADFEKKLAAFDKSKPLYVYCLSGGRSSKAADIAAKQGFKEVYNLDGGINAWLNADKPVQSSATGNRRTAGMSFDDYLAYIKKSKKLVLVDFNAVWCGPCKILKPIVHKVEKENASAVEVFEVDVDKNPLISKAMNITGIPLLILYKDGKEVWRNMGVTDEATILEQVKKYSK